MYNMNKTLQNDIFLSLKVQMVQAKMNLYLNLPVCSLISMQNIKDENIIINNYCVPHSHISTRRTTFQLAAAELYGPTNLI